MAGLAVVALSGRRRDSGTSRVGTQVHWCSSFRLTRTCERLALSLWGAAFGFP